MPTLFHFRPPLESLGSLHNRGAVRLRSGASAATTRAKPTWR
jgi:hypothetical protein